MMVGSLRSPLSLSLHLVQKVEIALVKLVHSNVAVLAPAGVALARRIRRYRVQRTEVTAHTADLVLEDLVVESGLELSLPSRRGGDVHGGLATSENDEIFLGGDGGAVERCIGRVGLENLKILGADELEQGSARNSGG